MNHGQEISLWTNRVGMSTRELAERVKVRNTLASWFNNCFHGEKALFNPDDMTKREVNIPAMFVRSIQSGLYSRNPYTSCTSQWLPPEARACITRALNRQFHRMRLRRTMKKVLQDVCLAGFGIVRVGYENPMAWSEEQAAQQFQDALDAADSILDGGVPMPREGQDHSIYLKVYGAKAKEWQEAGFYGEDLAQVVMKVAEAHRQAMADSPMPDRSGGRSPSIWSVRVPLTLAQECAFGWEVNTPFEEARWVWQRWVRPVEEVKANPYFDKKARDELEATGMVNENLIDTSDLSTAEWFAGQGEVVQRDVEVVEGVDIFDRVTGHHIVFPLGGERILTKQQYPYGDLIETAGFHKFSLIDDPDEGPGISALEAAASQIITINKTEWVLAKNLSHTTPASIIDASMLDDDDVAEIMEAQPGEDVLVHNHSATKPLEAAFTDRPQPTFRRDALAPLARAEGQIGRILGPSEARMGGGDATSTATASHVVAESTTEFFLEWGARIEDSFEGLANDVCQLMKRYYTPEDVMKLVGRDDVQAWPQFQDNPELLYEREDLTVDVGASLPGRKENEMRRIMELAGQMGQSFLTRRRELERKVWLTWGEDPDVMMLSRQEEQELAQRQAETSGQELHGSPELPLDPAADAGGQSQQDIVNGMRQGAARLSRAAS